jgi:hypothetical protein
VERGVKVVGAVPADADKEDTTDDEAALESPPLPPTKRRPGGPPPGPSRKTFRIAAAVAALGVAGTVVFGVLYFTKSSGQVQDPAVLSASRSFLNDFFNFTPKTVDSDFNALTSMATGKFATQANQFFNSNIRKALEQAAASARGNIRLLAVQQEGNPAGTASIYAVIDQTYANNKMTGIGSDVVRLTADLAQVNGAWKISNVTVLEGATPATAGNSGNSGSGSAGSSVPGQ